MASKLNNVPIRDFSHQAVILDTILTETTANKLGDYVVREPGEAFVKNKHTKEQLDLFDGNEFLGQKSVNNDELMAQYWGTVPRTQDVYNWEIAYGEDLSTAPTFQRKYLVKRDDYVPATFAVPFVGLYKIRVTAGGANYTQPPTISFSGGTGSGATAIALIDNQGRLSKITLKTQGNYTVAPTVVITPAIGDTGTGATATAVIQPQGVLLTKEVVTNNAPSPYDSLYIVVTRKYEPLPGPVVVISDTIEKVSGVNVVITKQKKLKSAINPGTVITPGVSVSETRMEDTEGSDLVAYEITTTVFEGPWHDLATSKLSYETRNFEFPGYLLSIDEFIMVVDLYGTAVGHRKASADNVIMTKREWWVIATDIPQLTYGVATGEDVHIDEISPGDIVVNGVPYRHVLHDDATRDYGIPITVPATTPTASEYYGTVALDSDPFAPGTPPRWIGTVKTVDGAIVYFSQLVSTGLYHISTLELTMR
jgi:hypothetical protein